MSIQGGKAAGIAAVTGSGSGLIDRFPTRESQQARYSDLQAQLNFCVGKGMKQAAADIEADMREIGALLQLPRRRGRPRKC